MKCNHCKKYLIAETPFRPSCGALAEDGGVLATCEVMPGPEAWRFRDGLYLGEQTSNEVGLYAEKRCRSKNGSDGRACHLLRRHEPADEL